MKDFGDDAANHMDYEKLRVVTSVLAGNDLLDLDYEKYHLSINMKMSENTPQSTWTTKTIFWS